MSTRPHHGEKERKRKRSANHAKLLLVKCKRTKARLICLDRCSLLSVPAAHDLSLLQLAPFPSQVQDCNRNADRWAHQCGSAPIHLDNATLTAPSRPLRGRMSLLSKPAGRAWRARRTDIVFFFLPDKPRTRAGITARTLDPRVAVNVVLLAQPFIEQQHSRRQAAQAPNKTGRAGVGKHCAMTQ